MSEPQAIRPAGLGPVGGPEAPRPGASAGASNPAFQALLESLGERAQSLETRSGAELDHRELAGAVDDARTSLEQMLSLKDQLLEAWRASRHEPGDAR